MFGPLGERFERTALLGYNVEEILPEILDFKPSIITGSPSYLRQLAETVISKRIDELRPKVLVAGGEPLDEPTRKHLENTFDCKAYNSYGAFDVGYLALECTNKLGSHILADSLVMEVMKDGNLVAPGERGDIVVTGLSNSAMPLLRYRLGDVGILTDETCSCGRAFPMLKSIEGRSIDQLFLPNGVILS